MQSTTALRKITALRKRIRVIQGGQGAGKSVAVLILFANHASGNANKELFVVSAELSKMRLTIIRDFIKVMQAFGIYDPRRFKDNTLYRFPNGSFIKFLGLDKEDIGKGLRCDAMFFNELNKVPWETYRQAASRAKNIYIDYNPDGTFYAHEEIIPRDDAELLKLTFLDNEYCPETEVEEILRYHLKGYGAPFDPNRTEELEPINKYWANLWRVYGLGEVGILQGAVYEEWTIVKDLPRDQEGRIIAKYIGTGVDWGWIKPAAVVDIWEYDGKRYWDEVLYGAKNSNTDIGNAIKSGDHRRIVYADQAEPKSINDVENMGVQIIGADKGDGSVQTGIKKVNEYPICVTARSKNIITEFRGYVWATDRTGQPTGKPVKKDDHSMDAGRYVYAEADKYSGEYHIG